jgi:hypothetical protein
VTLGISTCLDGDASRFAARMAQRFTFLSPERIMDAQRRRPDHPDYDPRTLYIPPTWCARACVCVCLRWVPSGREAAAAAAWAHAQQLLLGRLQPLPPAATWR